MLIDRAATSFRADGLDADDRALVDAVHAYVLDTMHVTQTVGLTLALARQGRVIWEEAFGLANASDDEAMTLSHTWPAGSFSKTYVATAVMQLVDEGVLDLYAPVNDYLKDFAIANPRGEREITLYDLLTHRSGLGLDTGHQHLNPQPLAAFLARAVTSPRSEYNYGLPLWLAKVGERYEYSSLGITIAGYAVEKANPEGLSFKEYVRRRITEPLGLASSGFPESSTGKPPPELLARLCTGYSRFGPISLPSPRLYPADSLAGSLFTTAGDHVRLLLAFMRDGRAGDYSLLTSRGVRQMITPQVKFGDDLQGIGWANGIGFELQNVGGKNFHFGHLGSQPWGWWMQSAAFPALDFAIVVLSNGWDMMRYFNPPLEIAPGRIVDFTAEWLQGAPASRNRAPQGRSWAWRASYLMGLMMVERTNGLLGVHERLDAMECDRMITETVVMRGTDDAWDVQGFQAGWRDAERLELTPQSITAFLASGEGALTQADLPLLGLWFGRKASLSIPFAFFANHEHR